MSIKNGGLAGILVKLKFFRFVDDKPRVRSFSFFVSILFSWSVNSQPTPHAISSVSQLNELITRATNPNAPFCELWHEVNFVIPLDEGKQQKTTSTQMPYRLDSVDSHLSPPIGTDKDYSQEILKDQDFWKTLPGLSEADHERYETPFSVSKPINFSEEELKQFIEKRKTWVLREHCDHRPLVFNSTDESIEETQDQKEFTFENGTVTFTRYKSKWEQRESNTYDGDGPSNETVVKGPFSIHFDRVDPANSASNTFKFSTATYPDYKIPEGVPDVLKGKFQIRQVNETGEFIIYGFSIVTRQSKNGCARDVDGNIQPVYPILVPKNQVPTS